MSRARGKLGLSVTARIGVALSVSLIAACGRLPDGSSIDAEAARAVGDAFMADMIADDVAAGLARMEPEFVNSQPPGEAERLIRKLFEYCGRPIDMEFKGSQVGVRAYLDGRMKPMRKLFYAATTTTEAKGVCFFSTEIVPGDTDLRVVAFGPLKLQSGTLPEILR